MDEARGHQQGSLSAPALSIVSSNIEGLTCAKQDLLAELCTRNNCDIICLQETHRGPSRNRPRIPGMTLITERLHDQYGSAIFVRNGLTVDNTSASENDNIEVLSIELMGISVSSVYKPPIETFILPNAVTDGRVNVVIGDFNSHSVTWGYGEKTKMVKVLKTVRMQIRCHSYMMQSSPTPLTAVGGDVDTTLT